MLQFGNVVNVGMSKMSHFQFGFIAIGVGYFIAFAVVEGSQTLNGQQLKWISAGLTLFAMIFSQ